MSFGPAPHHGFHGKGGRRTPPPAIPDMQPDPSKLETALHYASLGWAVFPVNYMTDENICSCGGVAVNRKCKPGKHPYGSLVPNGLNNASSDQDTVRQWFNRARHNIGIATGSVSGFWVLDIDGQEGATALAELEKKNGPLPETLRVKTGGGGWHYYFCMPSGTDIRNSEKKIGAGIDVRGTGGYVVAPRSNHESGGGYEWDGCTLPDVITIAAAPQWLIGKATGKNTPNNRPKGMFDHLLPFEWRDKIHDGEGRESFFIPAAQSLRGKGVDQATIELLLLAYNKANVVPPLDDQVVLDRARRYVASASPGGAAGNDGWPVPQQLPPALKQVPSLDPAILPVALRDWAVDTAERLQCPIEYLAMPALAGAGAIIGNHIGIHPKRNDDSWVVYPALWGGIVGPPGSFKTPAMNEALRPIRHLEEQAGQAFKLAYAAYAVQKQAYDLQVKQLAQAAKKGPMSPLPSEPAKPVHVRHVVNDITYQKLGEILNDNPQGVLALADELSGLLQSLDAPGQEAARGFFLAGWGGTSSYSFDRIQRGTIVLPRFCLSVFGGFQPDRIKGYVREAMSGRSTNDGLLQRFQLLVWPDLPADWKHVDRAPNRVAMQAMQTSVLGLAAVASRKFVGVPLDHHGKPIFRFTDAAQCVFDAWYQANGQWLRRGEMDAARHSHFAKYRSLVPGLALLYHLLDAHEGHVCEDCASRAINTAFFLRKHAERIYASVTRGDYNGTRVLAQRLVTGKIEDGFTARSLFHKGWADLSTPEAVHEAIANLIDFGWLKGVEQKTGGRPTIIYFLNPSSSADLL